ncbi:CNH domain-containing protein [Mycena albidolilacea]|uniref:CNH domain-containing protein n=1 Tax=Mycena albidolilacea TaxID=1033008 RepID=A0AAD7EF67_9AGAR|nr:CNH domain-containing protein [Mycena albidolilacea]
MSTAMMPGARPASPVDHDLQLLYDEVWAGFADTPTADVEIDSIYNTYSTGSSVTASSPSTPYDDGYSVRTHGSQRPSPGGVRRLPPTPSSPSSSISMPIPMPEPEPYDSGAPSPRPSVESYSTGASSDLLRQATTGSMRRLPSAPGNAPRPSQGTRHSDLSSHYGGMTRAASYRPAGAAAPIQPGSPTVDSYDSYPQPNGHHQPLADSLHYKLTPAYNDPSYARSASSQSLSRNASANSTGAPPTFSSQSSLSRTTSANSTGAPPTAYRPDSSQSSLSRTTSANSTGAPPTAYRPEQDQYLAVGPSAIDRRPSEMLRDLASYTPRGPLELHEEGEGYWEDEDEEEDETRFVNFSLLSHIAVQLRDKVPRGTHVKGSIPYPRAFTGKDIVSTIQAQIQRELAVNHGISTSDRRAALQVARSLQSQLFFYEVEWGGRVLQDGVEDVYMFLDDQEGGSDAAPEREELPTGVVTMLTKCYSPSCGDEAPCYSYGCPRRGNSFAAATPGPAESPAIPLREDWSHTVPKEVLTQLPESEIHRQTIIHKLISKEAQYVQDLDTVETVFLKPLRTAIPPVIPLERLEDFIDEVFGNVLDLRECNRRLLEVMYVRQREQAPVIQRIGDVFLSAATEFRLAYPIYIGHHPLAEKRLKEETDANPEFRLFLEHCSRQASRAGEAMRLDLKHFLNRPAEHLQKYPVLLEAIYHETAEGNPDADYLMEAVGAIRNLQSVAQLRTFQAAMGKGTPGKWEWHDLVAEDVRKALPKEEQKRQSIIFELIKGEMAYVKDLENIENMYIIPLRAAVPPIMQADRLEQFITDVFHNFADLHAHHLKLVEKFHEIQREQHPTIRSITAAMFDAALNFRDVYMDYIPNYPIAAYRIDDEMANNLAFKNFVDQCVRHADAHRLDMKNFINRPIPRLLRYELLLKGILDETPQNHDDRKEIPQVLEVIKALGKDTEPGVVSAKQKVELWQYNSNLVFKPGEAIDMDLLDPNRSLIHAGKVIRQPDNTIPSLEWSGWSELFVVLFDNYLVMTKPKERDGVTKYHVNRRPIPLDLLTLVNFTDPPTQRGAGLLRNLRGERGDGGSTATPESAGDSRVVYPWTIHHNGRLGGANILFSESAQARTEWKQKLEEAMGIRQVVQESNRVFEVETLSSDTFLVPSVQVGAPSPQWNQDTSYTGKVTCSVPFNTADGRGLVAIGCAEGVWIGFRHDPRSMRRVLHLKMVTQCAMLEEFGIFLVLADKSLFAYHIEALVPSSPQATHASQVPQKLNGTKDVHFFSVGTLHNRTLVIYMKKKGLDSIFRVLEPVSDKINEKVKAPAGLGSRLGFRSTKSEWFRIYRDFFLPSESFDLYFLKAKIVILCTKGFEIMDLNDFKSVTIPLRDEARLAPLSKRCDACRPIGMFRSNEDGFLLCYNEFGVYVDRHGDPRRNGTTIEWEGNAEKVTLHQPYILLFDSRFIEIRHIETGRLVQIIPGNDIRCLWDGRGVGSSIAATPGPDGEPIVQDAQVHAVMNGAEPTQPGGRPSRAVAQHVFELIPTVPLFLPEPVPPLPANAQSQYFAPRPGASAQSQYLSRNSSYSPPHSPTRASGSNSNWR